MDLLILLSILAISVFIANKVVPKPQEKAEIKPPCDIHSWIIKDEGLESAYMVCRVCGKLPGAIDGERL